MSAPSRSRHNLAHALLATALVFVASCSHEGDRNIWYADSVAIDFTLIAPFGPEVCKFSATRDELTKEQLDGLFALRLTDDVQRAGCDAFMYPITVHAADGSPVRYTATSPNCVSGLILPFSDFDAWASSTPCSRTRQP